MTANLSDDDSGIKNATLYIHNETGLFNRTDFTGYASETLTASVAVVVEFVDGIYTWFWSLFDWGENQFNTANRTLTIDSTVPLLSFAAQVLATKPVCDVLLLSGIQQMKSAQS